MLGCGDAHFGAQQRGGRAVGVDPQKAGRRRAHAGARCLEKSKLPLAQRASGISERTNPTRAICGEEKMMASRVRRQCGMFVTPRRPRILRLARRELSRPLRANDFSIRALSSREHHTEAAS